MTRNFKGNNQQLQSYSNIVDVVKSKLFRITEKFKKSLQIQSEVFNDDQFRLSNRLKKEDLILPNYRKLIKILKKTPSFIHIYLMTKTKRMKLIRKY
jgi:hypothetical protein